MHDAAHAELAAMPQGVALGVSKLGSCMTKPQLALIKKCGGGLLSWLLCHGFTVDVHDRQHEVTASPGRAATCPICQGRESMRQKREEVAFKRATLAKQVNAR